MISRDDRISLQILVPADGGARGAILVLPRGASCPEGMLGADLVIVNVSPGETTYQIGKSAPGRLLDGRAQEVLGFGLSAIEAKLHHPHHTNGEGTSRAASPSRTVPEAVEAEKRPRPSVRISLSGGGSMAYLLPSTAGSVVCIGRSRGSCDIRIDDSRIAKKHLRMEWRGTSYSVIDTSGSGTATINGESFVWPATLKDGDVVDIGAASLQFRLNSPDPSAIPVTPGAVDQGMSFRQRLADWCPSVPVVTPLTFLIFGGLFLTAVLVGLAMLVIR